MECIGDESAVKKIGKNEVEIETLDPKYTVSIVILFIIMKYCRPLFF
jgi:hypothetical protein